jgi:hypothetical protein
MFYVISGTNFIELSDIEKLPSTRSFESKGSFFGITGWNRADFFYVDELLHDQDTDDHFLRVGNPWQQLLYDYERYMEAVNDALIEIANQIIDLDRDTSDEIRKVVNIQDEGGICPDCCTILEFLKGCKQKLDELEEEHGEGLKNQLQPARTSITRALTRSYQQLSP